MNEDLEKIMKLLIENQAKINTLAEVILEKENINIEMFEQRYKQHEEKLKGLPEEGIEEMFKISKERIQQIDAQALRKLRNPDRSRIVAMSFCEPRSCIGRLSS